MVKNKEPRIKVLENGPYEVENVSKINVYNIVQDEDGASEEYELAEKLSVPADEPTHLCRCGHSKASPFCDGAHGCHKWDGAEHASFKPITEDAEAIEGPNYTLIDNEKYCAFARFCDAKGRVWNLVQTGHPETDKQAIKEACYCPAGRLIMYDNKTGKPIEMEMEPEIAVLEDPAIDCSGPLYVKGGIQAESADGKFYEKRNRQTLCRCGRSHNKPFCDGSHAAEPHYHAQNHEAE